jgi:hypothetical protein
VNRLLFAISPTKPVNRLLFAISPLKSSNEFIPKWARPPAIRSAPIPVDRYRLSMRSADFHSATLREEGYQKTADLLSHTMGFKLEGSGKNHITPADAHQCRMSMKGKWWACRDSNSRPLPCQISVPAICLDPTSLK